MGELTIDAGAVHAAASGLRSAADLVPLALPIHASGCGSAGVASGVENFNMWAKVTFQVLSGGLRGNADDADGAATAFEQSDTQIAASVGG